MTQSTAGYLPDMLGPVEIQVDGVAQTPRAAINFIGCDAADNPTYERLDITPQLGTMNSATLAAALTDETGTGLCVFNTTPSFATSFKLWNPANTFRYTFTPSAILANRALTLPLLTGDDTFAVLAEAQTFLAKTLVLASNTITDTSATTGDIMRHNGTRFVRLARGSANQVLTTNAGATDIAWATPSSGAASVGSSGQVNVSDGAGAWSAATAVLAGASFISIGATPSTTGALRLPNNVAISARDIGNTGDISLLFLDTSNYVTLGTSTVYIANQAGGNDTLIRQTAGQVFRIVSSLTNITHPICGGPSANAALDGQAIIAVAASNITLSAAQYSRMIQKFTGTPAATRTITYPHPASDDASYIKIIWPQQTVSGLVISTGTGTTVSLTTVNNVPHLLLFTPAGVQFPNVTA